MSNSWRRIRFKRDHRWAPDHMSAYLDGELALNGRRRLERHVGECRQCRSLLAGLRVVIAALHRLASAGGGADAVHITSSVRGRLTEGPPS